MDEDRLEEVWNEIWALLESGESEPAAAAALKALNRDGDVPELRYLLGVALLDIGEAEAAVPELEKCVEDATDWPDAFSALAWARFRSCRFDAAGAAVVKVLELDPDASEAHQLRGLLAERAMDDGVSLEAFARARLLDPERFPEPFEMDEEEFLETAQVAVAELDEAVREVLEETAFFVQPYPATELLDQADPPLDPQLLGLFVGQSLLERSVQDSGTLPNTLYLFQRNLERVATNREELEDEIRITVLHEIGHHLGWDEDDLERRGLA